MGGSAGGRVVGGLREGGGKVVAGGEVVRGWREGGGRMDEKAAGRSWEGGGKAV